MPVQIDAAELLMKYQFLILSLFFGMGCGSDSTESEPTCPEEERYNPILDQCEPARIMPTSPDLGVEEDASADSNNGSNDMDSDAAIDETPTDMGPDLPDNLTCLTDLDGDGHYAMECGGDDCDDIDRFRNPSQAEICDELDNNCDDVVNGGIDCTFFAHSDTQLYRIDPFLFVATPLGAVPGLFDIDTHPDGTLYGLTSTRLHTYDEQNGTWNAFPGELGVNLNNPNGMAIDEDGTAYVTGGNTLYTVNLTNGTASAVGSGNYSSSGDAVITKQGVLYMTSSRILNTDTLVLVDGLDGSGMLIGPTGHGEIWGLTAAWGRMFGMTSRGELIEINSGTGASTLRHTFNNISFYGAASTPNR